MIAQADKGLVRMSELRRRRRIRGYCAEPGCRSKTADTYRCQEHAAAYAARNKLYRKVRAQRRQLAKKAGVGRY